ncbi:tyrosine-type recombinase/integrase [Roseovarius sp. PS-C2]|uniref:tyrosine-type recombinase/integrase n=1 Tax=Roseovarius sp. PS-C2 TaxID=2820814 RepID=UPI001C0D6F3A|nr:tyrosine-type recombinase/integrase [Roseovarius sp. PS-C2]MBU3262105.1 tyrosine-type recombinase/integrase [Roseovarius sp. PS-C2]
MTARRKYLYSDTDRHGNRRWYFSPPGWSKTRLRTAEGTPEFRKEYDELFSKWDAGHDKPNKGAERVDSGSVEWLLRQYQASATFAQLAENTRTQRANFYRRFCRVYGPTPVADLTPAALAQVRDGFGDRRFAARNFVKAMRSAFSWACDETVGLARANPAASVRLPSGKTPGHKAWTLDHVLKFKDHYPQGHRARIALALLLFTVQRISDIRTMGIKDVRDGYLTVRHRKTGNLVEIPILGILRDELGDRYKEMIWWQSERGAPYSEKSASMRFSAFVRDVPELPDGLTAHGLRKCVPTLLAELGTSEDVIMSVLGDESADEARVYIQTAKRKQLATGGLRAAEAEIAKVWRG